MDQHKGITMSWKVKIRHHINHLVPVSIVNNLLLAWPALYATKAVNFETNLSPTATRELLSQIDMALDVEGNIIECGSARGGTTVIMANFLRLKKVQKLIYACDSFEGFDRAELQQERKAGLTIVQDSAFTHTSYEYVLSKVNRLGFGEAVRPVKGFFKSTLPNLESKWCLGFIDCDLKESLTYCAETIWPNLSPGGRLVFDDYTCDYFRSARSAVDAFVATHASEIFGHGLKRELYYVCKR
jgi:hypothetical protein